MPDEMQEITPTTSTGMPILTERETTRQTEMKAAQYKGKLGEVYVPIKDRLDRLAAKKWNTPEGLNTEEGRELRNLAAEATILDTGENGVFQVKVATENEFAHIDNRESIRRLADLRSENVLYTPLEQVLQKVERELAANAVPKNAYQVEFSNAAQRLKSKILTVQNPQSSK